MHTINKILQLYLYKLPAACLALASTVSNISSMVQKFSSSPDFAQIWGIHACTVRKPLLKTFVKKLLRFVESLQKLQSFLPWKIYH